MRGKTSATGSCSVTAVIAIGHNRRCHRWVRRGDVGKRHSTL
jgi:hypothetical protein